MNARRLSQLRQRLLRLQKERQRLEQVGFERSEMVQASLYERPKDPYPPVYYLSVSIDGVSRDRYVRKGELKVWRRRTEEWKRFWKSVARVRRLNQEIEQVLRAIGEDRCIPAPKAKRWRGPPRPKPS
jgi:hypothetical protein